MPHDALLLVLCSAVVHAGWNALLAGARDSRAATSLALVVGTLLLVPVAVATWQVERGAIPFVAASAVLQVAYVILLGVAYDHAPLSLVYPVARGASPVTALALSFGVGGHPGLLGAAGAVVVGGGVLGLRGLGRRGLALGLAIGLLLGTITTIDHFGVERAATFPYLLLVIAPAAGAAVLGDLARGRAAALRAETSRRTLLAGVGFVTTYALVLLALDRAPAPAVAAVRETSIVVAVALGALVLREPVTRRRFTAACVVTLGAALAALGS